MQSRITKWGNSLGLRLPSVLAQQAGLTDGQTVDLTIEKDRIILCKSKTYTLEELVSKITPENMHAEISTGKRRGREIW